MKKIILKRDPSLSKVNSQILFYQLSNGYFPICDERIRKTGSVPSLLQLKKGSNCGFTRRERKREFRIGRPRSPRAAFDWPMEVLGDVARLRCITDEGARIWNGHVAWDQNDGQGPDAVV
ncbi:hypothetical protein L484_003544 [Morus notabilis]|uniref:Uncharacterized protein n=1 Tax=Morus notabilis TaxID=981085 RepID=W9RKN2_9ROSA|nr:hypothetical protein L484_003544 [Morus notabilis]